MAVLARRSEPAKTASRANPALRRSAPARRPASYRGVWENRPRYDRAASSGSVVDGDPLNERDPEGLLSPQFVPNPEPTVTPQQLLAGLECLWNQFIGWHPVVALGGDVSAASGPGVAVGGGLATIFTPQGVYGQFYGTLGGAVGEGANAGPQVSFSNSTSAFFGPSWGGSASAGPVSLSGNGNQNGGTFSVGSGAGSGAYFTGTDTEPLGPAVSLTPALQVLISSDPMR